MDKSGLGMMNLTKDVREIISQKNTLNLGRRVGKATMGTGGLRGRQREMQRQKYKSQKGRETGLYKEKI